MRILVGVLLLVHGLISAAQARGSFRPRGGGANPSWLSWWPAPMGQSWLSGRLGREKTPTGFATGMVWLIAGACLIVAAVGAFGAGDPTGWWRIVAGVGAGLSLLLFVPYAHPLYAVGIGADLAIIIALLWLKWPGAGTLGS